MKTWLARHQDSSHSSINEAPNQLTKNAEMMIYSATLLQQQVAMLQKANEAASRRKAQKRRWIQNGGTHAIGTGVDLGLPSSNRQDTDKISQNGVKLAVALRSQRRCSCCRQ
jgi:hypothetical protein